MVFIFGGTLLGLLGLKYDSLWDLGKFFFIYFVIVSIVDFIVETICKAIRQLKNLSDFIYYFIYFTLDFSINVIILELILGKVNGVYYSTLTIILFSMICAILSIYLDKKF